MADDLFPRLPPAEAIAYFRAKGYKVGFAWQDVWQEEHARAFTVAKAMSRDVLETIRAAVDKALAEGRTLEQFRAELTPELQRLGWWGRERMIDPGTGQARMVQLGSPRRLKIIFDMNMRMARAAGLWAKIQRTKSALPYLRYTAVMDARTRPEHAEWHGTILPVDDPWWDTHYPPCGWNCRCTVTQLDAGTIADRGWEISTAPPSKGAPVPYLNPRTGEELQVPAGIDPGFAYNVGKAGLDAALEPAPIPLGDLPALEEGVDEAGSSVPKGAPEPATLLPPDVTEDAAIDAFLEGVTPLQEPVVSVSGTEIGAETEKRAMIAGAEHVLRAMADPPPVSPRLGAVRIGRRGMKKLADQVFKRRSGPGLPGRLQALRATPAVRAVIERGTVRFLPNEAPERKPAVRGYAQITAPILLDGMPMNMTVVAEDYVDTWAYYYHEVEVPGGRPKNSGVALAEEGQGSSSAHSDPKIGDRPEAPIAPADPIVTDATGWPLPVGRGWFDQANGKRSVPRGDRRRVLGLVGRAIASPSEIRVRWVIGADGTPMLFRRYIARVDGLAVVVDVGRAGWRFATERDPGFDLARLATGTVVWQAK